VNQWSQFDPILEEALEEHVKPFTCGTNWAHSMLHNVVKKYKHNQKLLQRTKWSKERCKLMLGNFSQTPSIIKLVFNVNIDGYYKGCDNLIDN
jgi:hypothetical protein